LAAQSPSWKGTWRKAEVEEQTRRITGQISVSDPIIAKSSRNIFPLFRRGRRQGSKNFFRRRDNVSGEKEWLLGEVEMTLASYPGKKIIE